MRAIGFRIEPKAVHWAVVEGIKDNPILVADSALTAPKTYDEAAALSWYRGQVLLLLTQYQPASAAIRYPEPTARSSTTDSSRIRVRIEGVILEALHTKGLKILTGSLKTISANIGSKTAKKYLSSDELRGLDWTGISVNRREAILAATATLENS